jgi:hypothetical protein
VTAGEQGVFGPEPDPRTRLVGLFGDVRNPLAHAPKMTWPMFEQDALDILRLVSLIHRKLDRAQKTSTTTA